VDVLEWIAVAVAFIVTVAILAWRDRDFWRRVFRRPNGE
jgi:hypothetical protein